MPETGQDGRPSIVSLFTVGGWSCSTTRLFSRWFANSLRNPGLDSWFEKSIIDALRSVI